MPLDKALFFKSLADALENKIEKKEAVIGITLLGSEHPAEMIATASKRVEKALGIKVIAIGPEDIAKKAGLSFERAESLEEAHRVMEGLLDSDKIDAAVTMHYNFPIGVSTVGRVITPARGKSMLIATTTGTSSPNRVEAMVKNAVYGIITAKALGIENPSIGILNVDGARQVERALKRLSEKGYDINFASSIRSDGGTIMRGNDLLSGSCDVMVTDTLTGNLLIKIFSAFTTGGDYEALGWGYGPGIGENYERLILILSRASGAPVVEGAIQFAAELVKGNIKRIAKEEFEKAKKAGLEEILEEIRGKKEEKEAEKEVAPPPKKGVTEEISGIDVLEIENAVLTLWKKGIYAESGMGCTGPVILVAEEDLEKAIMVLKGAGYIG
ncbi:MAG: glycine/sarcosine/betaine reductase complex component C subunit alpha [Thermovenabulum sp.]|uniref:glycine/sarcosine/betaine reductase complex component C subunit alpha n=1 Tax=Thermovenabulum sp. TaxID=3100335 RepID=UPI003C7C61DE